MRVESVLIWFAYILAGAMAIHIALLGIRIAERAVVWAATEIVTLRNTEKGTPP